MSVFLLVLIAVLLFIPGTLVPFTQGSQDNIVTANRIGDQLSEGTLGDPAEPHILNTSCTISFFQDSSPSECRYDGSTLQSRLGVTDRTRVNITLQGNVTTGGTGDEEILCWNGSNGLEEQRAAASCGTTFAIGATPPERTGDTVTARRVVSLNQSADSENKTDVALIVEVW